MLIIDFDYNIIFKKLFFVVNEVDVDVENFEIEKCFLIFLYFGVL